MAGDLSEPPEQVAAEYWRLASDLEGCKREIDCLRRLAFHPDIEPVYRRLSKHITDPDLWRLFFRQVFLAGISADHFYAEKEARKRFGKHQMRAAAAGFEFAECLSYLAENELNHGGLSLPIEINANHLRQLAETVRETVARLTDPRTPLDHWSEQSSGTARGPVFVRALEKQLHGIDEYGLHGLRYLVQPKVDRLLSHSDMAALARVALGMPDHEQFGPANVIEALKSYRQT